MDTTPTGRIGQALKLCIIVNNNIDSARWEKLSKYLPCNWSLNIVRHYIPEDILECYTSDIIISSTPYVKQHLQLLEEIKAANHKSLVCIHPHEGFKCYLSVDEYINGTMNGGEGSFRNSSDYRLDFVDRFYFWGSLHIAEWAMTLIEVNGLNPNAIRSVGSVYTDYRSLPKSKPKLRNILYCSGCMTYSLYTDEAMYSSGDVLGGDGDIKAKLVQLKKLRETGRKDRIKISQSLLNFAKCNPGITLTVKLHPAEVAKLKEFERSLDVPTGVRELKRILEDWRRIDNIQVDISGTKIDCFKLAEFDLILHHGSTVAVQSAFYRIPSLRIRLPHTSEYELSLPVKSRHYESLAVPGEIRIESNDIQYERLFELRTSPSQSQLSDLEKQYRYAKLLLKPWGISNQFNHVDPLMLITEDLVKWHTSQEEATTKSWHKVNLIFALKAAARVWAKRLKYYFKKSKPSGSRQEPA